MPLKSLINVDKFNEINKGCLPSELTANVKVENSNTSEVWLKTEESLEIREDVTHIEVQDNLNAHLQKHTEFKPFTCGICQKQFPRKYNLNRHLQTHTGIKPHSQKVAKKGNTTAELRSTDFYQQQINSEYLPSEFTANVKIEEISINSDPSEEEEWLKTEESLQIKKEVGDTKVQDNLNENLQAHTEFKPFTCGICQKQFPRKYNLNRHLRTHTGIKPYSHKVSKEGITTTELCNTAFHQEQINNECLSSELTTNVKIEKISIDSNPLEEVWLKTEATFESEEDVDKTKEKNHLQTHTGIQPHTCKICNKQFTRNYHLKVHLRIHTGTKPYECEICEKRFNEKCNLKVHLRSHAGIQLYTCKICEKQFTQKKNLNTHLRTHTAIKPHTCEVCKKQFTKKTWLNRHLQTHTGLKPYACEICNKQFTRDYHLKVHLRIHTGNKPYKCEICKKRFIQNHHLKIHLRIHTGIKPYTCEICKKQFIQNHHLKYHLQNHTGIKPYTCEKCGKQFTEKRYLKSHLQKHTGIKPDSHEVDEAFTTTELYSTNFHQQQINNECLSSELSTDVKIEETSIHTNPLEEEWAKTEDNLEIK